MLIIEITSVIVVITHSIHYKDSRKRQPCCDDWPVNGLTWTLLCAFEQYTLVNVGGKLPGTIPWILNCNES